MSRLPKVQHEWAFIDACLLFWRKLLQKPTVSYRPVDYFFPAEVCKVPNRHNVSTLKDNLGFSSIWSKIFAPFRFWSFNLWMSYFQEWPNTLTWLLCAWDYVIAYSWKNHWLWEGRRRWAFLGTARRGGDSNCFPIINDRIKGKYVHLYVFMEN